MPDNTMNSIPGFPDFGPASRVERMARLLASNWWAVALRGVFGILFGLIALFMPGAAILSLILVAGAYMLVDGIFGLVAAWHAAQADQRWGWLTFEGIVSVLAALVAFFWPFGTALAFVILLAAWSVVTGVFMLAAAFQYQGDGRGWMFFSAVVSVIFGILLLSTPLTGAVVLTWWIGAYAIVFGIGLIALAFKLRKLNG